MLKFFRLLHLYLGVFLAPALLFFALSGLLQTFGLHEPMRDHPDYKPAHWIETLANIHKHQQTEVPTQPKRDPPAPCLSYGPKPPVPAPPPEPHHPLPLRIFFGLVALGLCISTLTGLYMTWKYRRDRVVILSVLAAGIVVPLLLLML